MKSPPFDPVAAVETFYDFGPDNYRWLDRSAESLQPFLDRSGRGMMCAFLDFRSRPEPAPLAGSGLVDGAWDVSTRNGRLDIQQFVARGMPEALIHLIQEAKSDVPDGYIDGFLGGPTRVTWSSALPSWMEIPIVKNGAMGSLGIGEVLGLRMRHREYGCLFSTFLADRGVVPPEADALLSRLMRHLEVACRLQVELGEAACSTAHADAIFDANGRLLDARGDARSTSIREAARQAVSSRETARSNRARRAPREALDLWGALVAGRWTLVDHFESDGKRYILAVDNGPRAGLQMLTVRERAVVALAARGLHNKAIAHELGIAHPTVKVLMSRAAQKLGVRDRDALVARYLDMSR